jgi:type I restriction enzyme M protein
VELRAALAPLKEKRLKLQADVNRLTFDLAVAPVSDSLNVPKVGSDKSSRVKETFGTVAEQLQNAQELLSTLQSLISPPQGELDRLTRQFWVTKEQVRANKYDLSASRYRQVDADAAYHEKPSVTLERLARLEGVMLDEIAELKKMMKAE